mmetsp:Transcript_6089/g.18144  ORF Transcript_6089/g.18144 Transcript_6089/m.18144 type:complete len:240 (+) Transcript_6089:91-810(+)
MVTLMHMAPHATSQPRSALMPTVRASGSATAARAARGACGLADTRRYTARGFTHDYRTYRRSGTSSKCKERPSEHTGRHAKASFPECCCPLATGRRATLDATACLARKASRREARVGRMRHAPGLQSDGEHTALRCPVRAPGAPPYGRRRLPQILWTMYALYMAMLRLSTSCSGPSTRVKVRRSSASARTSPTAVTVAARGRLVSSAISPKYSPGATRPISFTSPCSMEVQTTFPFSRM